MDQMQGAISVPVDRGNPKCPFFFSDDKDIRVPLVSSDLVADQQHWHHPGDRQKGRIAAQLTAAEWRCAFHSNPPPSPNPEIPTKIKV